MSYHESNRAKEREEQKKIREQENRDQWVKNTSKSYQKDFPLLNFQQIASVVREYAAGEETRQELSRLQSVALSRQAIQVTDNMVMIWLGKFPTLDVDEVKSVLKYQVTDKDRKAQCQRLEKIHQQKKFQVATLEVEQMNRNKNKNNNSTNDNDDDDDYTTSSSTMTSSNSPLSNAAKHRIGINDDDDAVHASLWRNASFRQKQRMLEHYIGEYPNLNEVGVQRILESTYDLPAAEAAMAKHGRLRNNSEVLDHSIRQTTTKRLAAPASGANNNNNNNNNSKATATTTATLNDNDDHQAVATLESLTPGTAEYEITFFTEMFQKYVDVDRIAKVLVQHPTTEKRMEVLAEIKKENENQNKTNEYLASKRRVKEISDKLEVQTREISEYLIMFPKLSRDQIIDAMENSSDAALAMMRISERQEEDEKKIAEEEQKRRVKMKENHDNKQEDDGNTDDAGAVFGPQPAAVATAKQTPTPEAKNNDIKDSENTNVVERQTMGSGVRECVVCMERPPENVVIPCGHYCVCAVCAVKVEKAQGGRNCPVCRKKFVGIFRVY